MRAEEGGGGEGGKEVRGLRGGRREVGEKVGAREKGEGGRKKR